MKVVFRTDASFEIGTGHLMRCLTLAHELREKWADIWFICREHVGFTPDMLRIKGYPYFLLPRTMEKNDMFLTADGPCYSRWLGAEWETDADQTIRTIDKKIGSVDWLVTDHYAIDWRWHQLLRPWTKRILVIDDLADRIHHCDLLLDQNLVQDWESRYDDLVSLSCKKLLGPTYALLRKEFAQARSRRTNTSTAASRILVFFGGSDPQNMTERVVKSIRSMRLANLSIDVVVGALNPKADLIAKLCSETPSTFFYCQVDNMAELMVQADFCIGAGGVATWERCCVGVPSLIISLADNQEPIAKEADKLGAAVYLGRASEIDDECITKAILRMIQNPQALCNMSKSAMKLVDGLGAERVVKAIADYKLS